MNSRILNMERTLLPPEGGTMMMSSVFAGETVFAVSVVWVRKPSSGLMEMEPTPICNSKIKHGEASYPCGYPTPLPCGCRRIQQVSSFQSTGKPFILQQFTYNLIERHFSVVGDDLGTRLVHLLVSQDGSQTFVSLNSRASNCRRSSRRSLRGS